MMVGGGKYVRCLVSWYGYQQRHSVAELKTTFSSQQCGGADKEKPGLTVDEYLRDFQPTVR